MSLKVLLNLFLFVLCGCQANSHLLEPSISYSPPTCLVETLPSAFPPITPKEMRQEWAKELIIANNFAMEIDFYRAITAYKRALILSSHASQERRWQIEYGIIQSYYLGGKYAEALEAFEKSQLADLPYAFPALDDLLLILADSYRQVGECAKAERILSIIETRNCQTAEKLHIYEEVQTGQLDALSREADEGIGCFFNSYCQQAKSVRKAQVLNAVLPGAGYYYVGQKQAAITSFVINTLFIAAAYHFFNQGNYAAGLIVSSLESGWYLGGINGAGLAAKEYNERLYEATAKDFLIKNKLFPVLMLQYAF